MSPEEAAATLAQVMSRHVYSAGVIDGVSDRVDLRIRTVDGRIHRFVVAVEPAAADAAGE